ncbi:MULTISPECIES: TRAP transporter substrate-binding protein [Enterocloster]|uniref:Tripartite ATP-independent transporter solute receptor, DctP family n=1 Tax=Enterocloster lavalensis TaxID=460384 RepID=A0A1I0JVJ3_9FIRM|nr:MULTISPECIES: TRAP transporter substrate-binding protein [Enterocloster]MDR3755235.1 TRAP transporter substrate-binding protein [Enterocloster sp.]PST31587.1 C4-dicarboxylate ABC transporter [Enterocloster lavalensis]SEU14162.1 tripartite ATP-independent transporter solute receptor, DctP family [Enterocloster lavalensis]
MKKMLSLALSASMVLSLAACGGSGKTETTAAPAPAATEAASEAATEAGSEAASEAGTEAAASALDALDPVTLTIYSPGNENSVPTKTILEYKKLVEEASGGKITLDAHHSGELGNDAEALQSARMGTIDIIFAGTSGFTEFYDKAKILDLPFLFDSAEQAYEVVNGEIGEKIFADLPSTGLIYLAEGDNGMRHISTTNRPVHTAADVEGLKLRVPTSQMYLDCWEALGANPVALALNELAIALSNGTAEGQDNATYHLVANATYDDIKYFSFINYMWMGCTMAANSDSWDKLPAEYQEILKEQAKVAAKYSFDTIAEDNKAATETLKAAGVEFDENPDIQSFIDKLGGNDYYLRYKDEPWYNQEILDEILAK